MTIILLIAGLALILFGSDWLVDGASSLARKFKVSEFVIGLTIVGFGTSCPELVVSLTGAFQGNADISVGNVIGSNIFNVLLILGLTALIAPISITRYNARRDVPLTLLVSLLFVALGTIGGRLSFIDGIVFLAVFSAYLIYCFKSDKADMAETEEKTLSVFSSILLILAGLAGLIFGGDLFVDKAVELARAMGASDKFIAVTLLAGGTSLPELATCIVAAAKHKDQLALGNILGSNIFNLMLITGCSALVTPLSFNGISIVDLAVMLLSVVLVWTSTFTGRRNVIDRWEGAIMLAVEAGYMAWLIAGI